MKLTEIAIDGYKGTPNTHLHNLGSGLNVIFGTQTTQRRVIADFIPDVLYGYDARTRPTTMWGNGYLQVNSEGQKLRVSRNHANTLRHLSISDSHGQYASPGTSEINTQLNQPTYGSLFFTSLEDNRWQWQDSLNQLNAVFDLPQLDSTSGMPFLADHERHASWKRAAETRITRLESMAGEIERLNHERTRLISEQSRIPTDHHNRVKALEREIAELQSQADSLTAVLHAEQEKELELHRQINDLECWIDREQTSAQRIPVTRSTPNHLECFYERLDDVDHQVRLWRSAQSDIQNQRLRLRDEMVTHGELNILSQDHPYHEAREIILALESRVNTAEETARCWEQSPTALDTSRNLTALCQEMKKDLQVLCNELKDQYKHVRYKAAVAELKQLRRCYHEMDESVRHLLVRRESVIDDIRRLDPAGADAISLGEQQFTLCAQQDGLWAARQKFVSAEPLVACETTTDYRTVHPDLSRERTRLVGLNALRTRCQEHITELQQDLQACENHWQKQVDERNALLALWNQDYTLRIDSLETRLRSLESERLSLQSQVEADRPWMNWRPNFIFEAANRFMEQLSGHALSSLRIDSHNQLTVSKNNDAPLSMESLPTIEQGFVRLSLSLAAVEQLALRGIRMPLVIEDAEHQSHNSCVIRVLESFCCNDHQVILLTGNPSRMEQGERFNSTWFELPDTSITSPSWYPETPHQPRESNPITPAPASNHPWNLDAFDSPRPHIPEISRGRHSAANVSSVKPETLIPTPLVAAPRTGCTRQTMLQDIDLVESIYLTSLENLNIQSVGQLLEVDLTEQKSDLIRSGFNLEQLDRWQAQAWLLICFSDMTANDARVLLGSGVDRPEMLAELAETEILDRIRQYLDTSAGKRSNASYSQFSSERLRAWASRVNTDNGWRTYQRSLLRSPQLANHPDTTASPAQRLGERRTAVRRPVQKPVLHKSKAEDNASQKQKQSVKLNTKSDFKFFLKPSDELEAAPSIGPKTAEKFVDIGIVTVQDFLEATVADMATQLGNRRLSKNVLKTWQQQSRLMCDVPNLRGHDAQILVSCEILDADELAKHEAASLLDVVLPFVESKEGARMLRNARKPDLTEVTEWIQAANYVTARKAA